MSALQIFTGNWFEPWQKNTEFWMHCSNSWISIYCGRDLFRQLDTDNSGGISLQEMSEGLAQQGYSVSLQEVEQLVARLDLDADGHIQMDEFAASMIDWSDVSLLDQHKTVIPSLWITLYNDRLMTFVVFSTSVIQRVTIDSTIGLEALSQSWAHFEASR